MKIKKLLCLLLAALLLTGCSAKTTMDNAAQRAPMEMEGIYDGISDKLYSEEYSTADSDTTGGTQNSPTTQSNGTTGQKLIRTMDMEVETENLDELLAFLDSKISALGGYLENKSVRNGSSSATRRYRYANLKIRVPVERLDEMVEHISGQSNVVNYQENADDITLSYVATQSRVKALEVEQDRLLELLAKADNTTDLLQIEQRLTEVRTELENVASRLRLYDNLVDYGTVELQINEVQVFTVVEEETVWQRITRGFAKNLKGLGNGIVEFVIFLVVSLPYLVPLAAVVTLVVVLARRRRAKKKALKNPPFQTDPPENKE